MLILVDVQNGDDARSSSYRADPLYILATI